MTDRTDKQGFEGLGQKHWKSDRVKDLERAERHETRPSFVQVYTGDGKGKTTAALGLIVRSVGYGHRCSIVSFLKGDPNYGELRCFRDRFTDAVDWHLAGRMNFVDPTDPDPADVEIAQEGLATARAAATSGDYAVVVLDEINVALSLGLVEWSDVKSILDDRADGVEVVCTGRDAPPELVDFADLVTDVRMVKHFYTADVAARRGIEF